MRNNSVQAILAKLNKVQQNATGWTALCPAHDDKSPSLSITEGSDERTLLFCHAGCSPDSICGAMGITLANLFPDRKSVV